MADKTKTKKVRVRFAPSPTGFLHIGGIRTALYNYLFAKKHDGDFILRIEDTDQSRYVEEAEEYIIEALKWCGIEHNEGVGKESGKFGSYRQSERKDIYKKYAYKLVEDGKAYFAFDTPEELDAMRKRLKDAKSPNQQYNAETRGSMINSISLSPRDTMDRFTRGDKFVIRLKLPENEDVVINDEVLGKITFNTTQLDDKILFKSDGMPTYHLANVVDDHLMQISHVIRGSEWVNSTPSHILLYNAFEWDLPVFAHLPLILKPNGKGKLSKRDGIAGGFPVFPLEFTDKKTNEVVSGYKEEGYINDAFINMLALLGWNEGTDQEVYSKEELIKAFSLKKVGKSGACFNPDKAKWFNRNYIQEAKDEDLAFYLTKKTYYNEIYTLKVIKLIKSRLNFRDDIVEMSKYFFNSSYNFDKKEIKRLKWNEDLENNLVDISIILNEMDDEDFTATKIKEVITKYTTKKGIKMGVILGALRLVIVGSNDGVGILDIIEVIGQYEAIDRIEDGVDLINFDLC